jgi:hypothetical protein
MRRLMCALFLLCSLTAVGWAGQTLQWLIVGTATTLLTPNSVGSNGYTAVSSAFNNTIGATGNGSLLCKFQAVLAFGSAPSANAAVLLWIQESSDGGATFDDTPSSTVSTGPPRVTIPITAGATSTKQTVIAQCPAGQFKATAQLQGTGQTTTGAGNTITVLPFTVQAN